MGLLLMLLTIGGFFVAALLLIGASLTKKAWIARFTLGGAVVWLVFYAVMLLGSSLTSKEQTIAVGDTDGKAFCGFYLDCHMHAAVTGVRTTKTLGNRTANGQFYIVKVRVSSNAVKARLSLTDLAANVHDAGGEHYHRDREAEAQLPPQPAFETPIGPNDSFEKEIVFDLPLSAGQPRLDLREGFGVDHMLEAVLIGDEDSILHKRQLFELTASQPEAVATGFRR